MLYGPRGAKWVFYSWFVIGVIGLALGVYSLSGVEAGMLMEPAWNVGDASRLMLHADKTWSGPGGWLKAIKWSGYTGNGSQRKSPPGLWFVLALPSILVFIAWPLSGLTMEMTEGYRRAYAFVPATLKGHSYETFNERGGFEFYRRSQLSWKSGQDIKVPGAGIVYTPKGFDRKDFAFLNKLPTTFPRDQGVPTIFITAQAERPIEGRSWGILLEYNCKIIEQVSDFQILRLNRSAQFHYTPSVGRGDGDNPYRGQVHMDRRNQTSGKWSANMNAVIVTGVELWPDFDIQTWQSTSNFTRQCYFKEHSNSTADYPGLDPHRHEVFEIAVWQELQAKSDFLERLGVSLNYNTSIDHNITDFFGKYDTRQFLASSREEIARLTPRPMTAIGVQCNASSNVGSADIDGVRSSYSNFRRTDTPVPKGWDRCAPRFGAKVPLSIIYSGDFDADWFVSILESGGAPAPEYGAQNQVQKNGSNTVFYYSAQLGYLQAEHLRRSMLRVYASFAEQLMYSGGQAHITFTNDNATAFESGQIITPGVMPAIVPVTLFCIWALISSSLGIVYGFRRRWTETMDGHTMFRLGAELSVQERAALLKTSNVIKKQDRVALDEIPALVGNTKPPGVWLGRIGLVRDVKADKKKLYE